MSGTANATVGTTYNSVGATSVTAYRAGGAVQTTAYVYGVSPATGSAVTSNDVVSAVVYPNPTTGLATGAQEVVTIDALGQRLTMTDRNGTVHAYAYDVLGRGVSDAVTTLGAGADGAVRRIETAYDGQGNAYLVTSFGAAAGGAAVNQVEEVFNGLGQLVREYQAVSGAVDRATTPSVQYAELAGGSNTSRLVGMTYPDGYTLNL